MKLVLVADAYPPMRTSAAVQLRDLTREFVRQGHQVTVLLPANDLEESWDLIEHEGARILRLAAPKTKDVGYVRRTIGEWLMPYAMKRSLQKSPVASEIWDGVVWYSPSIFHGPLVRALKTRSECKSYLIIRDIFPEWALDLGLIRPGLTYSFFRRIAREQYEVADIIGVQSPGNLGYFDTQSEKLALGRVEVLQNWLSPPGSLPCPLSLDVTPLSGRKVFVYAGNMGVAQGLDLIIELADALRDRKDIGFLFVGRGSEAGRLEATSKDRGLDNVLFHPEIDPDEIPSLYMQCAAGIVCLDRRHKSHNIPGKFLTYMQCGLPSFAIVNHGNDLAELVRTERVGAVCETHEIKAVTQFCSAMVEQLERGELSADRCRNLFHRQFSVSQAAEQIVAALG